MRYPHNEYSHKGRSAVATRKHSLDDHRVLDESATKKKVEEDTIEARRAGRMVALKKVAGIWSDRPDIPADGLQYQRELRSE
jgi:hypothetical protein